MRPIDPIEQGLIAFLARTGGVKFFLPSGQRVWVVNPEMGSIRADYCLAGCRVRAVASHQFEDDDGVPIIVTLLLTEDGRFGELDFWKVSDEPIISLPVAPSS